jgi:hypothetical protein
MANADNPNGLKLIGTLSGGPHTAKLRPYEHPSSDGTAVYVGDLVKQSGTANADGIPTAIQAAATDTAVGVVIGVEPKYSDLSVNYVEASTTRLMRVCIDPHAIYEIQEDSGGGSIAVTAVGNNADVVVGSGNNTTGSSGMELDSSDVKTATAQLRILQLVQREDNATGTNARWEVSINEHRLGTTTGI